MLPKELRLPPKEIPTIARYGRRVSGNLFDVKAMSSPELLKPQFAISISTKVGKLAPVRNLIRRRLRVAIQELVGSNEVEPKKYLIIVRSEMLKDREINVLEILREALTRKTERTHD